ncbi:hypothetical protein BDV95DRAFT_568186 [Massariosphaeria phaeospora]|uniref:Uncharacterized protein n=1 Tax=Massariosphaeria phaeospora TaxID=100035 RepID=A0A7C8I7U8_9PLEO|nr:hypothetical protein BDV95DRAFT_568186 [Massariosphaeria phaeospora]
MLRAASKDKRLLPSPQKSSSAKRLQLGTRNAPINIDDSDDDHADHVDRLDQVDRLDHVDHVDSETSLPGKPALKGKSPVDDDSYEDSNGQICDGALKEIEEDEDGGECHGEVRDGEEQGESEDEELEEDGDEERGEGSTSVYKGMLRGDLEHDLLLVSGSLGTHFGRRATRPLSAEKYPKSNAGYYIVGRPRWVFLSIYKLASLDRESTRLRVIYSYA